MSTWQNRVFEIAIGGADASPLAFWLRVAVIACSCVVLIQLSTLWGTRWGDRKPLLKSFLLSLLVHISIVLAWASVAESDRILKAQSSETPPIPIQIVWDDTQRQSSLPEPASTAQGRGFAAASAGGPREQRPLRQYEVNESMPLPTPQTTIPTPSEMDRSSLMATGDLDSATPPAVEPRELPKSVTASAAPVMRQLDLDADLADKPQPAAAPRRRPREISSQRNDPTQNLQPRTSSPRREPRNALPDQQMLGTSPALGLPPEVSASAMLPSIESTDGTIRRNRPAQSTHPSDVVDTDNSIRPSREKMILRGVVTDEKSGKPLRSAQIRLDRLQGPAFTATTASDGSYELPLSDVPEHFAVTVTRRGYLPESRSVRRSATKLTPSRIDFSMQTSNKDTVLVEEAPAVRHVGNDRFEGQINSQFQRPSEGASVAIKFQLAAEALRSKPPRAALVLFAKGVQCPPEIRINGQLLAKLNDLSPDDGSFGQLTVLFDPTWLKVGPNVVTLQSVACQGDLDDFEFVNLQVKLLPAE